MHSWKQNSQIWHLTDLCTCQWATTNKRKNKITKFFLWKQNHQILHLDEVLLCITEVYISVKENKNIKVGIILEPLLPRNIVNKINRQNRIHFCNNHICNIYDYIKRETLSECRRRSYLYQFGNDMLQHWALATK